MKLILTLLLVCAGFPALQPARGAEPRDVMFLSESDHTEQRYVELLPENFNPDEKHDLVLVFHGHGSDRWQFIRETRDECRGVRDVAALHGMILLSPDYRAKTSWMGPLAEADVLQILKEVKQQHKIRRVFLAGGSMGGTAVLTFTALHPELVDGVCSLNGTANLVEYPQFQEAIQASFGGTKAEVPEEYRRRSAEFFPEMFTMPLACTTGGQDTAVPPESVLRLVELLKKSERQVLSLHHDDGGHSTNYADTSAAMEFILSQAEQSPP
jgi:dipeptidyl aminopeptidase/acylaminoacyl peptidase